MPADVKPTAVPFLAMLRGRGDAAALRQVRRVTSSPIGFHECRHTFAYLMIAAGVNAKALSTYLGHSSIQLTFDLYGHLMPGNEVQAARLRDGYLEASENHA